MTTLNFYAKEFIPSDDSPVMVENRMFDKLEEAFVNNNKWLFDECALKDVKIKELNEGELDEKEVNEGELDEDEIINIYNCYDYEHSKFPRMKFDFKLETIIEEDVDLNRKKTYAEILKV